MDKLKNIYYECSLKYSFIYPRYISDCHPREITSSDTDFTGDFVFPTDFVFNDRKDEFWHQKSKFENNMIVPDNDLIVKKIENNIEKTNYIYNTETYIHDDSNEVSHYLNNILDDKACIIKRSCGYWLGNTNTKERYQKMKTVTIENTSYIVTMKRIWGFDPELAESYDDISGGFIEGFSKKQYTLFAYYDTDDDCYVYIPTVDNKLLDSNQIQSIIEYHTKNGVIHYPNYETGKYRLFVSD